MAGKAGSKVHKPDSTTAARGKQKVEWKGYVNVTVNDSMKRGLSEVGDLGAFVDQEMEAISDGSYDVKIRYDGYNQCWQASLYCVSSNSPNSGWCLAIRGKDWFTALCRVLYIHSRVFEGLWSADGNVGWSDDNW